MLEHSFSITPKQAAGLTAKFLLFQTGFFVAIGMVLGVIGAINRHPPASSEIENPWLLTVVNSMAVTLVLQAQLRRNQATWSHLATWGTRCLPLLPVLVLLMIGEVTITSEVDNRVSAVLPPPQWIVAYGTKLHDLAHHPFGNPFALIVMAAVTEEFLFRGLILRGLLARVGPAAAVVISAGLFAVMHLNPWQMPGAFLIGVILGWVYLRTRSLVLCFAGHAFHNAVVLLATGLPFAVDGFNRGQQSGHILYQPWWFTLPGLMALATGALLFHRLAPPLNWTRPDSSVEPPLLLSSE